MMRYIKYRVDISIPAIYRSTTNTGTEGEWWLVTMM